MKKLILVLIFVSLLSPMVYADKKDWVEKETITKEIVNTKSISKEIEALKSDKANIEKKIKELENQLKQAKDKGKITISIDKATHNSTGVR